MSVQIRHCLFLCNNDIVKSRNDKGVDLSTYQLEISGSILSTPSNPNLARIISAASAPLALQLHICGFCRNESIEALLHSPLEQRLD